MQRRAQPAMQRAALPEPLAPEKPRQPARHGAHEPLAGHRHERIQHHHVVGAAGRAGANSRARAASRAPNQRPGRMRSYGAAAASPARANPAPPPPGKRPPAPPPPARQRGEEIALVGRGDDRKKRHPAPPHRWRTRRERARDEAAATSPSGRERPVAAPGAAAARTLAQPRGDLLLQRDDLPHQHRRDQDGRAGRQQRHGEGEEAPHRDDRAEKARGVNEDAQLRIARRAEVIPPAKERAEDQRPSERLRSGQTAMYPSPTKVAEIVRPSTPSASSIV